MFRQMGFDRYFSSLTFVMLSVNLFNAVVARSSDRNRIATFFEKLVHCL